MRTQPPTTTNLPPRPPSVWLSRQLYLVDSDEEFREFDDASLRLVLADDFDAHLASAEVAIFGAGGPATAAEWIAQVEDNPSWHRVVHSGALHYAVLE